MTKFDATLMHGERGGEGKYSYDASGALLEQSALETVRGFMDHLMTNTRVDFTDWHINAAMKNKEKGVVTAMGALVLDGDEQPFVVFITQH